MSKLGLYLLLLVLPMVISQNCPHVEFQSKHVCPTCETPEDALRFSRLRRCQGENPDGSWYGCNARSNHVIKGFSLPATVDAAGMSAIF